MVDKGLSKENSKRKRELDGKWRNINRRAGSSVGKKRKEKHRLKCCLATKDPEDCTVFLLLLLYVSFLGHSSLLSGNSCRGEALKVSVEMQGRNQHAGSGCIITPMGWGSSWAGQLTHLAIFFQVLSFSPKNWNKVHHTWGKYSFHCKNTVLVYLNQVQVCERKKGEFCPWAYLCQKDI